MVRDLGRFRFRRFGVNPTGAMDPLAARIGNILVGNYEDSAVIEAHFPTPEIRFTTDTVFAVTGADFSADLDGVGLQNWRTYRADEGSTLSFRSRIKGNRCYLAVAGGLNVPRWLGSSTTNIAAAVGGFKGRKLSAGDRLDVSDGLHAPPLVGTAAGPSIIPQYHHFPTVRIVAGAEFDGLINESRRAFLSGTYEIGERSDLMGFSLIGPKLETVGNAAFLSSAVSFGTIQLPPLGDPILLMADHQTSGGYPRIGHIISCDLPLAAQLGCRDRIAFHLVDIAEAHSTLLQTENDLKILRAACRIRSV